MAEANIKERIKEMRLRVLAIPLGENTTQMDSNHLSKDDNPEYDIKLSADNKKTNTKAREQTIQTKPVKKPKSGKKKASEKFKKQHSKVSTAKVKDSLQREVKINTIGQVEEFQNEHAHDQLNEHLEEEIEAVKINPQIEPKKHINIKEPITADEIPDEQKKSSTEIIELTDKWVELEVRSRLSGLEKQEKQTRAMLKEIVEILDRIETTENSKQASPAVSKNKLAPISPTSQMPETIKRQWQDALKRIFVVIGTFIIFTGVIWGILLYLFFDI